MIILMTLSYLFYLLGFLCLIIVLIQAFKENPRQGILALLLPPYLLYYLFARFHHPRKALLIAGLLGGFTLGAILFALGYAQGLENASGVIENI